VTWVDTSKLKRTIASYNDEVRFHSQSAPNLKQLQLDDYSLMA
jgi:hypothetical protein